MSLKVQGAGLFFIRGPTSYPSAKPRKADRGEVLAPHHREEKPGYYEPQAIHRHPTDPPAFVTTIKGKFAETTTCTRRTLEFD